MAQTPRSGKRPRIAVVGTAIRYNAHFTHILDRFLDGYGWGGGYHRPTLEVASVYADQRGEQQAPPVHDLAHERAERHPEMKLYPSIAEALTLGTGKLAVDGVVVVGEQGNYPRNANGMVEHPHFEFFEEVTKVFRSSGRSVPYYNDKELAWRWDRSKQMVDTSHELGFPIQGGSSLAVTHRIPPVEIPLGAKVREAVVISYAAIASEGTAYDFHALEAIQSMVERRKGGETGVEWVQAYRGEGFWKAYEEGVWSQALVKAALSRSLNLTPAMRTFTNMYPTMEQVRTLVRDPVAYHYQHRDGLRCTMLLMNGLVHEFTFAAQIEGEAKPFSTLIYLPEQASGSSSANYFSAIVNNAEQMFLTGKAQYPIERTLLTTGLMIAGVESVQRGMMRMETPNLAAISYQPNPESTFWRN